MHHIIQNAKEMTEKERALYLRLHPKSVELSMQTNAHFLYGVPMHWMSDWSTPAPLFVSQARGAYFTCADDITYTDFCLGDTGAMFGHSPAPVALAISNQANNGLTTMLPSSLSPALGQALAETFALPIWQLATTATDANRFVLRWARAVTGRKKVLVFDGCYHGTIDDAMVDMAFSDDAVVDMAFSDDAVVDMALSDDAVVDMAFNGDAKVKTAFRSDPMLNIEDGKSINRNSLLGQVQDLTLYSKAVPFNDLQAVARELASCEYAAILTEPALTNCGMVLPANGFIQGLRTLCSQYGSLLILDETHTISTAHGGWAKANDVLPDFLVIGKPIAGGIPAAAYGFSHEMATRMQLTKNSAPPGHSGIGTTLSGNMMTIAAMHATLTEVAIKAAYAHMLHLAEMLESQLNTILKSHQLGWNITRLGARLELQFSQHSPKNAAQARVAQNETIERAIHLYLLNRGVLLTPFHNMMLICPATTIEGIEILVINFDACLREIIT